MSTDQEIKSAFAAARIELDRLRQVVPASRVPPGKRGKWSVERFEMKPDDKGLRWGVIRAIVHGERGITPPGTYTKLVHVDHGLVMSDTLDETRDHYDVTRKAHGRVLIMGLGLGMVAAAVSQRPDVSHVTVVEHDADVIKLVGPHVAHPKLSIIRADANKWTPGVPYDVAWVDIWNTICGDAWQQAMAIKQRLIRHKVGSVACWCEAEMREAAR